MSVSGSGVLALFYSLHETMSTGLAITMFGLVAFSITEWLAPRLGFSPPDRDVFKRVFPAGWDLIFGPVESRIGAFDWSPTLTSVLFLSVLGMAVIAVTTIFQVTSMTAVALAHYHYSAVTVDSGIYYSIAAWTTLFAASVMIYGNRRIQWELAHR